MNTGEFRRGRSGYQPIRKLRTALSGIKHAVLLDFSVRYKLVISIAFLIIAALFETLFHFLFVLVVTGLMLMAEIFNTVAEALCDYLHPGQDERIKAIKDMAAGAAWIVILIWYLVLLVVVFELFSATELFSANGRR